jgi:hypothetical protein
MRKLKKVLKSVKLISSDLTDVLKTLRATLFQLVVLVLFISEVWRNLSE